MNPLDLGVIAVILLSAIFAFARGFVREALSIIAWVGAAAITLYGFNWAYGLIEPHAQNPILSQVIAGFGLFVVSLIVLTVLTGIVARLVHVAGLTLIDRTLGFIFGLARGAFLVCLAFLLLDMSVQQNDRPGWIREARSAPYLHEGAAMLQGLLPETVKVKSAEISDQLLRNPDPQRAAAELAKRASGALAKPTAAEASPAATAAPPTYPAPDRRQLDRVIRTQQPH